MKGNSLASTAFYMRIGFNRVRVAWVELPSHIYIYVHTFALTMRSQVPGTTYKLQLEKPLRHLDSDSSQHHQPSMQDTHICFPGVNDDALWEGLAFYADKVANDSASTSVPRAMSSIEAYSSGRWLYPLRQGIKSMATGATRERKSES